MAETKAVCEQLHLPLQSGSNRVLAAMRRGYTAERYLERLAAARAAIADLAVSTDIIVGFPGETEADFQATLELVAEAEYDSAFTFIFSPRPGTKAAQMEDDFVPAEVVAERFERLKVVAERSALARHRARIGKVEEALVEGSSKKDERLLTGRTRQGKLVHFAGAWLRRYRRWPSWRRWGASRGLRGRRRLRGRQGLRGRRRLREGSGRLRRAAPPARDPSQCRITSKAPEGAGAGEHPCPASGPHPGAHRGAHRLTRQGTGPRSRSRR